MSILSRPEFSALSRYCDGAGASLYVGVKHADGTVETFGCTNTAVKLFNGAASGKKRLSGDWIPESKPSPQKLPMRDYFMKTKSVIPEFRKVIKFFIGKQKLGSDDNGLCLWESKVSVNKLFYSKKSIRMSGFRGQDISLSTVIDWHNLKPEHINSSPPKQRTHEDGTIENVFKLNLGIYEIIF